MGKQDIVFQHVILVYDGVFTLQELKLEDPLADLRRECRLYALIDSKEKAGHKLSSASFGYAGRLDAKLSWLSNVIQPYQALA